MRSSALAPRVFALSLALSLCLPARALASALRQTGLEESPRARQELVAALSGLEESAREADQAIQVALSIVPFRDTALFLTRTEEALRAAQRVPQQDWAGLSGDFRSLQQQLRAVRVLREPAQKSAAAELRRSLHGFHERWRSAFGLGNAQPAREASAEQLERFRVLLHESAAGNLPSREELLRRWGASGQEGQGIVIRLPQETGKLYLFGFLRSKGVYTTVLLSFPSRLRGQLIRMVPRIEESRLFLDLHETQPARLFRTLQWHTDSASFKRVGSVRAEKLRLIPEIPMPVNGPRISVKESFARDTLSRLTGIPEGLLAELEASGFLYRDPTGKIPGGLAVTLAEGYRQTDREEYPIGALQDLLGKKKREAQRFPARKGLPVIQRPGQERRLSRGIVLKFVLERRAREWIREHVGGFVIVEGEPDKMLGLPAVVLREWPDPVPEYDGYPLWVKLNHRRLWTRKGFEGLKEQVKAVAERLTREKKVILLDAVKEKYPGEVGGDLARRYLEVVRAVRELGVKQELLADHPLAALRTVIAADGKRMEELFREAERPTRWKADQIRLDRSYGVPAVARLLGWTESRVHQRILYRKAKIQSEQFFGRRFIPGAEVRRLLREQAGLEEDARIALGWERLGAGTDESVGQAKAAWMPLVSAGRVDLLYVSFQERLRAAERLPGTADFRAPALERRGFAAIQEALADPDAQFGMGEGQIRHWRDNLKRLEEEFPERAERFYRVREKWNVVGQLEKIGDAGARLKHLRVTAGFESPHDLEKAAGVAWAVVSRAEEGKRGLGPEAGEKVRRELERRLFIPLTLSFKFLKLPLNRSISNLPDIQQRQEFIQQELLGWPYKQVVRRANALKHTSEDPLPEEQVRPADRSRARTRRLIRLALEQGLLEKFQGPVKLDGHFRVVTDPVSVRLQGEESFERRLGYLLDEVLLLSWTELLNRTGTSSHFSIGDFGSAQRRREYAAWRPILEQIRKELKRRDEEATLDEDLLPLASAGPSARLGAGLEEVETKERRERFRMLLREAALGSATPASRHRLVSEFGAVSWGIGGIDLRVPPYGDLYLFDAPSSNGAVRPVSLSLGSRRLRNKMVRLIPGVTREGQLLLNLFLTQPLELVRQVKLRADRPAFVLAGKRRHEVLNRIPRVPVPTDFPWVDEKVDYPRAEVGMLTQIPEEFLTELSNRGYLYVTPGGQVPGEFIALLRALYWSFRLQEYPVSALQDALGIPSSDVHHLVSRAKIRLVKRRGQPARLTREDFLLLVIPRKLQPWVEERAGGWIRWQDAARQVGVPLYKLAKWSGAPPVYDGAPLWVRWGRQRHLTRPGFRGFLKALARARRQLRREGRRILLDEVKVHYRRRSMVRIGSLYKQAIRAVQELGIPHEILPEHPLAPVRPMIAVPRSRRLLDRIFREVEHPTHWTAGEIREERWYGIPAASEVLGWPLSTLQARVRRGEIPSRKIFDWHWISGKELLRLKEGQVSAGPSTRLGAGLEEFGGWTRREILKQAAGGFLSSLMGAVPDIKGVLEILRAGGMVVDSGKEKVIAAIAERIGGPRSVAEWHLGSLPTQSEAEVGDWMRQSGWPIFQGLYAKAGSRWAAVSYAPRVTQIFFQEAVKERAGVRQWLKFLEGPSENPLLLPAGIARSFSDRPKWKMGSAAEKVDLLRRWREEDESFLAQQDKLLFVSGSAQSEDPVGDAREWLRKTRIEPLAEFARLGPEEQRQILRALLKERSGKLDSLLEYLPRVRVEVDRLEPGWKRQFEWAERRAREKVEALRQRLHEVESRVPQRAVFIVVVQDRIERLMRGGFLDDWEWLRKEVRGRVEWQHLTLEKIQLRRGQNLVQEVLRVAAQHARPGTQATIGLSVGVLHPREVEVLRGFWPVPMDTTSPRLATSFLYTPYEELKTGKGEALPSITGHFLRWVQQPLIGPQAAPAVLQMPAGHRWALDLQLRQKAGLEEGGWSRRQFLQGMVGGALSLPGGGLADLPGILKLLTGKGIRVDEDLLGGLGSIVNLERSFLELELDAFRKDPGSTFAAFEQMSGSWIYQLSSAASAKGPNAAGYAAKVAAKYTEKVEQGRKAVQGWLAHLDSGGLPTRPPAEVVSGILIGDPAVKRGSVDIVEKFLSQSRSAMQGLKELFEIQGSKKDAQFDEMMRSVERVVHKPLELFREMDPAQQREVLRAILKDRLQVLESMAKDVSVVQEQARKLGPEWTKRIEGEQRMIRHRVEALMERVRTVQPRVPPRAVFVAFFQAGKASRMVDDWAALLKAAKQNPALREVTFRRVMVGRKRGKTAEEILAVAREYMKPGTQATIGFSGGVLSDEEAERLRSAWPQVKTTMDPWLAYSFLYLPKAKSDARGEFLSSPTTHFLEWVERPEPGIRAWVPRVSLPSERWWEYEFFARQKAGLEEAAGLTRRGFLKSLLTAAGMAGQGEWAGLLSQLSAPGVAGLRAEGKLWDELAKRFAVRPESIGMFEQWVGAVEIEVTQMRGYGGEFDIGWILDSLTWQVLNIQRRWAILPNRAVPAEAVLNARRRMRSAVARLAEGGPALEQMGQGTEAAKLLQFLRNPAGWTSGSDLIIIGKQGYRDFLLGSANMERHLLAGDPQALLGLYRQDPGTFLQQLGGLRSELWGGGPLSAPPFLPEELPVLRAQVRGFLSSIPATEAELRGEVEHLHREFDRVEIERAAAQTERKVRSAEMNVPARSLFVAFVPVGRKGADSLVDDWAVLRREVRRNPRLQELELRRVPIQPGEDVVERVFSLMQELAVPGSQRTVGFALGVLTEEQAVRLQRSWPEVRRTDDPWLAYSARYVPQEALDAAAAASGSGTTRTGAARSRQQDLVPTISLQFARWLERPFPGAWPVLPEVMLPPDLWQQFEYRLLEEAGLEEDLDRREFLQRAAGGTVSSLVDWSQFLKEELGRVFRPEQLTVDRQKIGEAVVDVLDLAMDWKHDKLRDLLRNPSGTLVKQERIGRLFWVKKRVGSFSPDPMTYPGFSSTSFLAPFQEYARLMNGWVRSLDVESTGTAVHATGRFVDAAMGPMKSSWNRDEPAESAGGELVHLLSYHSRWMERASGRVLNDKLKGEVSVGDIQRQERVAARYREMAARMQQLAELPREEQNKFLLAAFRTKQRQYGEMLRRAEPLARSWAGRLQDYWRRNLERQWGQARRAVEEYPEIVRSVGMSVRPGAVFVGLIPDPDDFVAEMKQVEDWALLVKLQKEQGWQVKLVREQLEDFANPIERAAQIAREMAQSGFVGQVGIALGVLSDDRAQDHLTKLKWVSEDLHREYPAFRPTFLYTSEEALWRAWRNGQRPFPSWSGWFAAWASDPVQGIMHVMPGLVLPTELREWFERQMQIEAEVGQAT